MPEPAAAGRRSELKAGFMSRNRVRAANGRERAGAGLNRGPGLPGLRWVPVPLAALMAVVGWLVLGAAAGQHAAAHAEQSGYQAAGLALSVDLSLIHISEPTRLG